MTSSYSSALNEFFNLHTTAKDWKCQSLIISVATNLDDDTPRDINLADTIGRRKNVPPTGRRSDENCYWLFKTLNENNETFRQKKIHPIIVRACHAAGFIVHGEYEHSYKCIQQIYIPKCSPFSGIDCNLSICFLYVSPIMCPVGNGNLIQPLPPCTLSI